MTAEEYAEKVNDNDAVTMYDIFRQVGLVDEPLERNILEKMKMALGYSRETEERSTVHSRSGEFTYASFTAETLSDAMHGNLLLAATVLRFMHWPPISIHEWSDEDSFVIGLSSEFKGTEQLIAVHSFCNLEGDHFDIFDDMVLDTWPSEYMMKQTENLTGFGSYNAHSLRKYLCLCEYTPCVDENGYCMSDSVHKPDVPGNILFCADPTGMSILEATYTPVFPKRR